MSKTYTEFRGGQALEHTRAALDHHLHEAHTPPQPQGELNAGPGIPTPKKTCSQV